MDYIVHRRCRGVSATGEIINIPYRSEFRTIGRFIATADAKAICVVTSDMAHKFFARNDDGNGLLRGRLTYAIAYSPRERTGADGKRQRFTDGEIQMLQDFWSKYLRQDTPGALLFNHDFFNADISDLEAMAKMLNLKY
jgi:hypothetical protein